MIEPRHAGRLRGDFERHRPRVRTVRLSTWFYSVYGFPESVSNLAGNWKGDERVNIRPSVKKNKTYRRPRRAWTLVQDDEPWRRSTETELDFEDAGQHLQTMEA